MIEVQDFAAYGLIVDLRTAADFDEDRIPGAVRMEPPAELLATGLTTGTQVNREWLGVNEAIAVRVPAMLQTKVDALAFDDPVLVYDGIGGRVAEPLAAALRRQGRDVDVLPGGWSNYRRWVQGGLQFLPRLFEWRVLGCPPGHEASAVLEALRSQGHQVLDVGALDGPSNGWLTARLDLSQAWFESLLVDTLRRYSGRWPVWTVDLSGAVGSLRVPVTLVEALSIAPAAALDVGLNERALLWRRDEPALAGDWAALLQSIETWRPEPDPPLIARWQALLAQGDVDGFVSSLLRDHVDERYWLQAQQATHRRTLPPLTIRSFEPMALASTVGSWMPAPA